MNVNKHPKVALAWTLEGVNDAEADRKRPGDGRVETKGKELGSISWCNDTGRAQKTEPITQSGRRKTMNKHKKKHKKFMR